MDMAVKFRFWIRKRLDQCFGLFHLHILIKWFNCCLLAMISRFAKHFVHICIVNASVLRLPLHLIVKVNWLWGSKRSFYVLIIRGRESQSLKAIVPRSNHKGKFYSISKGYKFFFCLILSRSRVCVSNINICQSSCLLASTISVVEQRSLTLVSG